MQLDRDNVSLSTMYCEAQHIAEITHNTSVPALEGMQLERDNVSLSTVYCEAQYITGSHTHH